MIVAKLRDPGVGCLLCQEGGRACLGAKYRHTQPLDGESFYLGFAISYLYITQPIGLLADCCFAISRCINVTKEYLAAS